MRSTDRSLVACTRGSATTEGVIVAVFMTIVMGAVLFAYRGYRAQIATVRAPLREIWPEALAGCEGGSIPTALRAHVAPYEPTAEDLTPPIAPRYDVVRTESLAAHDERSIATFAPLSGATTLFAERAEIACNTTGRFPAVDWYRASLDLFCDTHPGPLWPEGCDLRVSPGRAQ